jgi:hypothetical protein
VRIDPYYIWLREVVYEQPDYMWCYQVQLDSDPGAKKEAWHRLDRVSIGVARPAIINCEKPLFCNKL